MSAKPARMDLDYDDVKSGFMVGRAARMADWAFKKEQREFEVLVNRLRVKRWQKANPERVKANDRRWRMLHRQVETARVKRWRHARTRGRVFTCASRECEVQWCRVPGGQMRANNRIKYCSGKCFNRERYLRRFDIAESARRAPGVGL